MSGFSHRLLIGISIIPPILISSLSACRREAATERAENRQPRQGNARHVTADPKHRDPMTVDRFRPELQAITGDPAASMANAKEFLAAARKAGASDQEICDFIFREYSQENPGASLVVLGQVASRDEFLSLQRQIIGRVAMDNLPQAIELVKIFPSGQRFEAGLSAILRVTSLTPDKLTEIRQIRGAFNTSEDLASFDAAFDSEIHSKEPDPSLLRALLQDGSFGPRVEARAELLLWNAGKKTVEDLAVLQGGTRNGLSSGSASQIISDLVSRGIDSSRLLQISEGDGVLAAAAIDRILKDHGAESATLSVVAGSIREDGDPAMRGASIRKLSLRISELDFAGREAVISKLPTEGIRDQARATIAMVLARQGDESFPEALAAIKDSALRRQIQDTYTKENPHE